MILANFCDAIINAVCPGQSQPMRAEPSGAGHRHNENDLCSGVLLLRACAPLGRETRNDVGEPPAV